MIALMARAFVIAALVALAALAVERAVPARGRARWIWAGALVCAALLPWLGSALAWVPELLPWDRLLGEASGGAAALGPGVASGPSGAAAGIAAPNLGTGVMAGWLLASAALAAVFCASALRLRRILRSGAAARIAGVPVRLTPALGPAVVGVVRPRIAVPRWLLGLTPAEIRLALAHEREHVRAGDTRLLAGAAATCALMPWNLPLWWMARRLARAVESDCDARVLAVHDAARYGRLLLRVAAHGGASRPAALALVGAGANLERRILAMSSHAKPFRILRALPLLAAGLAALVVACDAAEDPVAPPAADAGAWVPSGAVIEDGTPATLASGHAEFTYLEPTQDALVPEGAPRDAVDGVLRRIEGEPRVARTVMALREVAAERQVFELREAGPPPTTSASELAFGMSAQRELNVFRLRQAGVEAAEATASFGFRIKQYEPPRR